jgi:D-alanine--poly(phosphoribitol) ligase subunit 2
MNASDPQAAIHARIVEIARQLGNDASQLRFDEEIPASGFLDSAGLMELMMWFETAYDLTIDQDDLTIANFGTIDAMVAYLQRIQSA